MTQTAEHLLFYCENVHTDARQSLINKINPVNIYGILINKDADVWNDYNVLINDDFIISQLTPNN